VKQEVIALQAKLSELATHGDALAHEVDRLKEERKKLDDQVWRARSCWRRMRCSSCGGVVELRRALCRVFSAQLKTKNKEHDKLKEQRELDVKVRVELLEWCSVHWESDVK
jgi:N-acetylglucosamine kinase-like BadF-type ATPase